MSRHLLLALFLLWAQIGAVAHEATHLAHHDLGHASDKPCLKCLAYAPLGAGAISSPLVLSPPERFPLPTDAAVPASPASRFIPTYLSRAPPSV